MATAVRPRFDDPDGDVEVDCAGLTFMDASGINLLLEIERLCDANGAKLTVVNPPRCVTRLFSLAQLDGVFDIRSERSDG
jgi:anti-anti-sigma factor